MLNRQENAPSHTSLREARPAGKTRSANDQDIEQRLDFIGLDDESCASIRSFKSFVERELPIGLDKFYAKLRNTDEIRRFFPSEAHIQRAKGAQEGHWANISSGDFGSGYVEKVRNSSRADEAGHLVAKTRSGAERSGQIVQQAVVAMSAIDASSKEIASIIGVIDEIAFQTNLLALNAIVDAAREQSLALQEINEAVNSVDQSTQRNSAMVEQSTINCLALVREVDQIANLLGAFKIRSAAPPNPVHRKSSPTADLVYHQSPHPQRSTTRVMARQGAATAVSQKDWEEF